MHCMNCGTQMVDGAKFCPRCGAKVVIQNTEHEIPNSNYYSNSNNTFYAGGSEVLPMRWYKFIIYFQLFFSAFLNVVSGIMTMTGAHYQGEAKLVYMFYKGLRGIDITMGIVTLVLAGGAIWVRYLLKKFQKMGPFLYLLLLVLNTVTSIMYVFMVSIVTGMSAFNFTIAIQIIVNIALFIWNYIYFNKRKSMFVN